MDTQQELRARARAHELAGRDAAALDGYRAFTATPEGAGDGTAWMWMGEAQLRLGQDGAADSFDRAARIFAGQGLGNVALALFQRALRARPSDTELLLRIGELSATLGYAREARLGYVEYAERKVQEGDAPAAVAALGDYLARFPEDAGVARRLAELGGEPPARPAPPTAPAAGEAPVPPASPVDDLIPTRAPEATELEGIQRLEGLETTHADEAWASEVVREVVDDSALPLLGSGEDAWRTKPPAEPGSGADDDLPLLGMEPQPPRAVEGGRSSGIGAGTRPGSEPGGRLLVTAAPAAIGVPSQPVEQRPADRAEVMERILADLVAAARFAEAADTAEELVALRPGRAALQRWVELAFRAGERTRLVRAFLALARQLDADLDRKNAQELWRRVRELDPANEEAQRALAPISAPAGPPPEYVDLGSLVMDDAPAPPLAAPPPPDEPRPGASTADPFAQRTAQAATPRTGDGYLDLGLAFKEMGMLDDAISQLQNALRHGARPLPTLEALGECYFAKGDHALASRVLERAVNLPASDEGDRMGILYWLARSREALGEREEARGWYRRLLAVDAGFRDAATRLAALGA